jgi:hypothetical protein
MDAHETNQIGRKSVITKIPTQEVVMGPFKVVGSLFSGGGGD